MSNSGSGVIRLLGAGDTLALEAGVWPCYDQVIGDFSDYATWRTDLFDRHAGRDGYRLAVALDDDEVIGFAWGYVGQRGQYWTDLVHDALPSKVVARWVGDHFEFVELAVLSGQRGTGPGRALHDRLLDEVTRRCLLSTSDEPGDPAVKLYIRSGWRTLGMLRPGVQVMASTRRWLSDSRRNECVLWSTQVLTRTPRRLGIQIAAASAPTWSVRACSTLIATSGSVRSETRSPRSEFACPAGVPPVESSAARLPRRAGLDLPPGCHLSVSATRADSS